MQPFGAHIWQQRDKFFPRLWSLPVDNRTLDIMYRAWIGKVFRYVVAPRCHLCGVALLDAAGAATPACMAHPVLSCAVAVHAAERIASVLQHRAQVFPAWRMDVEWRTRWYEERVPAAALTANACPLGASTDAGAAVFLAFSILRAQAHAFFWRTYFQLPPGSAASGAQALPVALTVSVERLLLRFHEALRLCLRLHRPSRAGRWRRACDLLASSLL
jgi:hypothetical protein